MFHNGSSLKLIKTQTKHTLTKKAKTLIDQDHDEDLYHTRQKPILTKIRPRLVLTKNKTRKGPRKEQVRANSHNIQYQDHDPEPRARAITETRTEAETKAEDDIIQDQHQMQTGDP